jgi:lipid A 3-O-deacylase
MTKTTRTIAAALTAMTFGLGCVPASAADGMAIEAGSGDSADMGRVAIQWNWQRRWFERPDWHLGGYWDLGLGYWRQDVLPGQNGSITEVGLTPVLRLQRNDLRGPYLEAGIGLHYLSKTRMGDKRLSTRFQFGDHIGAGYRFGARRAWDLGYRYQHLSNADIKRPNNGINFHQIRLQYHF